MMTITAPGHDTEDTKDTAEDTPATLEPAATSPAEQDPSTDPEQDPEEVPGGDMFSRAYVQGLRKESAQHRSRASDLEGRLSEALDTLWAERVAASGRLADPSDLPRPDDGNPTPETIDEAIAALIESKPHLAARRVTGSLGQGEGVQTKPGDVSLADMLRAGA